MNIVVCYPIASNGNYIWLYAKQWDEHTPPVEYL